MPKNKPNKGLLKRIRLTKTGKVKFTRAFGRHKRSHKSASLLRSYHRPAFVHPSDTRRVAGMLHKRICSSKTASKASTETASE